MSKPCDALKFSTRTEQQEYWALRPLKQQLQPNAIITKTYAPDVIPQVKLIVNNDERKNNINFVPPKAKSHDLENYSSPFNQFDYLGHHFARKINNMVYLKFFNNKYNMMADCKQRTRVMPAFYVPFQQIYSEQEHTFTHKMGFKFPQKDPDSILPVQKNNRGCAFDPVFCSQFETGNLFAAIRKSPFDYELILQNDVNSCQQVGWFNFSMQFFMEGYYTFCIKNMTKNMTKLFKRGLRINYCFLNNLNESVKNETLDDWNTIGENVSFKQNGIQIENQPGEYYYDLYFQYKCKNKHQIVAFALEKPYSTLDAEKYFTEVAPTKLRGLTKIERVQYGKTMSGTPLVAYLIKKRRAGTDMNLLTPNLSEDALVNNVKRKSFNAGTSVMMSPDPKHKTVFIMARMGAQDVSSSHVMEGMVDFLLDTMDFDMLKRTVNFYFIPIANVDSVKYGNSLTNLSGSNLFDCWRNPHKIYQAEIYYLKNFMAEINKDYPICNVFNFASEFNEIYSSIVGTRNDGEEENEDSRIFPFVLSKRHKMFSFEDFYFHEKGKSNSMTSVLTQLFPDVLAYQFKISRFQFEKEPEETSTAKPETSNLKQCSAKSYFNFGRKFMEDFLEHVKIYQKNNLLKNKWLRQIQDLQDLKPKDEPIVVTQRPVEQRFPERFYTIKGVKPTPAKPAKSPKRFDPYALSRRSHRSKENSSLDPPFVAEHRNMIVRCCFADLNKKKKEFQMRAESLDDNIRKTLGKMFEKSSQEKPAKNHFRIKEKTHEVLKNCNSNLLGFEMGIVSNEKMRHQTNSPYVEKQRLKKTKHKQLSLNKLRKIKNDASTMALHKDRSLMLMKP